MQLSRKGIDSTYSCAVDFELSNERDIIKIATNTSCSHNSNITHVKPEESCLKYSVTWKNTTIDLVPTCDRFGQLKIISNQRIAVIGKVEKNSKGEWQIGSVPQKRKYMKWFNVDIFQGILLILRESESDCRNRLYGSTSEELPHYTLLESLHTPPTYDGDEESALDMGIPSNKIFTLPFSAQSSIIRKLAPFHEHPGWQQEILFMILVVLVVVLAILPIILGGRFSFFWYWPLLVLMVLIWARIIFRNYLSLIRIEKFRLFLRTIKMFDVSGLKRNIANLDGQIVYVEGYARPTRMTLEAPFLQDECLYWWLIAAKK